MPDRVVAVSGGFDPVHVGHLDYLEAAARLGDRLVVLLNSDDFLTRKKGAPFMAYDARARILASLRVVDEVVPVVDEDQTVCDTLRRLQPDVFCNGGDRGAQNTPEAHVCAELGIDLVYGVGGGKTESSSWLLQRAGTDDAVAARLGVRLASTETELRSLQRILEQAQLAQARGESPLRAIYNGIERVERRQTRQIEDLRALRGGGSP